MKFLCGTFTHSVLWPETDKPDALGGLFIFVTIRRVVVGYCNHHVERRWLGIDGNLLILFDLPLIHTLVRVHVEALG